MHGTGRQADRQACAHTHAGKESYGGMSELGGWLKDAEVEILRAFLGKDEISQLLRE